MSLIDLHLAHAVYIRKVRALLRFAAIFQRHALISASCVEKRFACVTRKARLLAFDLRT
jgi:hypothetical protein